MPSPHYDYYDLPFAQESLYSRMAVLSVEVPENSSVLDLGCNDGRISKKLLEQRVARKVFGVDICDFSDDKSDGFEFLNSDIIALDLKELGAFDTVLMLNIGHHLIFESIEKTKALFDNLLQTSAVVFCDLGSFSERGECGWRNVYDQRWSCDEELWEEMFERAVSRRPLLRYSAQFGGHRILWRLGGHQTQVSRAKAYLILGKYRRIVSSDPREKGLIRVTSTLDMPRPFGEEAGNICPDVMFYDLRDSGGDRYWAKKWTGERQCLQPFTQILENFLKGLWQDNFCLPTAYSEAYGAVFEYNEALFNSKMIVHYWDRHQHFNARECRQIELIGELQVRTFGLPMMSLNQMADFQIAKVDGKLIFLDFEIRPEIVGHFFSPKSLYQ